MHSTDQESAHTQAAHPQATHTTPVATIFARQVREGHEAQYEEWLAGISRASSQFPGNQGTTVLRPAGHEEYIAITHFESRDDLDRWIQSSERGQWLEKLKSISLEHEEIASLAGMERWFTAERDQRMPPRYKTAALVLMGLYPTVLLLNEILAPWVGGLPGPLRVLVSLMMSVSLMVWFVLPALTRLFHRWLHPTGGLRLIPSAPEEA